MKTAELFAIVAPILLGSHWSNGLSTLQAWAFRSGGAALGMDFHPVSSHRPGNYDLLLCQYLLALDVAVQSHCYVVGFFANNYRHQRVVAGFLSSA
jgi:hypothetical protein